MGPLSTFFSFLVKGWWWCTLIWESEESEAPGKEASEEGGKEALGKGSARIVILLLFVWLGNGEVEGNE